MTLRPIPLSAGAGATRGPSSSSPRIRLRHRGMTQAIRPYPESVTSGREIAGSVLKPALLAAGWKARAAGWFTKNLRPAVDAVIAVTAASEHHAAGSARVTFMVGLRDDAIEGVVEQMMGPQTPRYQGRTWVTPLGYLLPDPGHRAGERDFDDRDASRRAAELVHLLARHAEPQLDRIANDPAELRALVEHSSSSMGPHGLCRVATLVARAEGLETASQYVAQRLSSLADRSDPSAALERDAGPRVLAVLRSG